MPMEQQIQHAIDSLLRHKARIIIAIDGNCGAGKTTLAGKLAQSYDCNVIHMDDFFLRPQQRTPERYEEIGGNVDYERFREEVLVPLQSGNPFSYRPFDCKTLALSKPVPVVPKQLTVIEGSYSMHPYFGEAYDLKILLTASPELQHRRIRMRPAHLHNQFFTLWIPMENRYLEHFRIRESCHLVF
jgi:uridine kinase